MHAGRAGHRLDDHRGDVRRVVQRDQLEQIVGELGALGRHAALEAAELGVRQVIGLERLAVDLAVADDAADRDAAEVDAVVALLAADEPGLGALALEPPVRARHLERGVGGLGARAAEEHVIEAGRRQGLQPVGELERRGVAELERRRVVERRGLALDRLDDLAAAVAQARAPQARQPVEDLAAAIVGVVRALGGDDHARVLLELAIAGEGHPVGVEPGSVGISTTSATTTRPGGPPPAATRCSSLESCRVSEEYSPLPRSAMR
jgi:hypothetical protein